MHERVDRFRIEANYEICDLSVESLPVALSPPAAPRQLETAINSMTDPILVGRKAEILFHANLFHMQLAASAEAGREVLARRADIDKTLVFFGRQSAFLDPRETSEEYALHIYLKALQASTEGWILGVMEGPSFVPIVLPGSGREREERGFTPAVPPAGRVGLLQRFPVAFYCDPEGLYAELQIAEQLGAGPARPHACYNRFGVQQHSMRIVDHRGESLELLMPGGESRTPAPQDSGLVLRALNGCARGPQDLAELTGRAHDFLRELQRRPAERPVFRRPELAAAVESPLAFPDLAPGSPDWPSSAVLAYLYAVEQAAQGWELGYLAAGGEFAPRPLP